ncbi:hypothetical protein JYT28_00615, partial [Desulfobulbus sp. AH-315-M07]|nr:hypothetical protein [Desulfobulbus sp. AH-315-M07]
MSNRAITLPPRLALRLALSLVLVLITASAHAQDPTDLPPSTGGDTALRVGLEQDKPFWRKSGRSRYFLASTFEFGVLNVRPTLAIGYGRPHYRWFGLETQAAISRRGGTEYIGLLGKLSGFSARVGLRYVFPLDQRLLAPKERYVREDLETERGGKSRYLATEAEMAASFTAPGGNIFVVASAYALLGLPDDRFVFEESLRVVIDPPLMWRARLGYLFHIGWEGTMRIGAAGEVIGLPQRKSLVVRAGPALSVS